MIIPKKKYLLNIPMEDWEKFAKLNKKKYRTNAQTILMLIKVFTKAGK